MYASPEQTKRESELDGRSDIWSLGVIMFQALSLLYDVPFDPIEIRLGATKVPDIRDHAVGAVPEGLARIVMKALRLDPAERWQSALEMQVGLVPT